MVSGRIVDSVTNILNSKLFAHLGYERRYLKTYLDSEVDQARSTFWFMEKMRWFQFTATLILQVGMILYGLKVWSAGLITVGQFTMVTSLSLLIIGDARNLSRRFLEFFEYVGNIMDGVEIIATPHEITDSQDASELEVSTGEIEFKDVTFRYGSGKAVFEGLNIKVQPGEKVGLVGFSGSGKTTFLNLVLRLYDLDSGSILIDGSSIAEVTQDSLRGQISVIPQEPMLFHRSLMENIRYGSLDASDEEVIEASKKARAHDFILEQAEGYDTLVGERGIKLSGGQRQRIAIARAILKDAKVLLMDEATSSLDSVTEKEIQGGLRHLVEGRTVLVIAHRLSTISHLDRILVFHEGKVVEDGNHSELLMKAGHYLRLWEMQAGGFLPEKETEFDYDLPNQTEAVSKGQKKANGIL